MAPPTLRNKIVSGFFTSVERSGLVGIPDHRNMAIFQLADKITFTMTFTSDTSRVALWFLSIFHAGYQRKEEGNKNGEKTDAL